MEMNGEWENSAKILAESLAENPNSSVSRILAESDSLLDEEGREKSFTDCVRTIKIALLEKELEKLGAQLNSVDIMSRIEMLSQIQNKKREIIELKKIKK